METLGQSHGMIGRQAHRDIHGRRNSTLVEQKPPRGSQLSQGKTRLIRSGVCHSYKRLSLLHPLRPFSRHRDSH